MAKKGLSLPELRRAIASDQLAPVYLLLGAEPALRRRAVAALVARFSGAPEEDLPGNIVRLDGAELTLDEVVDEARSLPLFAMMGAQPSRLVTVSDLERLLQPRRGGRDKQGGSVDVSSLLAYLEAPVAENALVFEAAKLDKRTAVYKALAKHATVVDCEPPTREGDVRRWIEVTARAEGHEIARDAVVYLVEMVGSNISALEQELEKAILYVGPGGRIDTADLEGLTGRSRAHSVFELTDALVKGRAEVAMRVLNRLLDDGEHPLRLLPMVAWITRQLVIANDLLGSGGSRREAMEGLAGRWDQRGEILDRASASTRADLAAALVACADADIQVKRLRDTRPGVDRLRPARGTLEALCRQICAA